METPESGSLTVALSLLGEQVGGGVLKLNLLPHGFHVSPQVLLLGRCTIIDTPTLRSAAGTSTCSSVTTLSSG